MSFLDNLGFIITQLADVALAWGWILLLFLAGWIAWETYTILRHIDYTAAIQWTYFQITVPEDNAFTPKSFENAVDVWGGMHKDPDLAERLFEGYFLPWYSCELVCSRDRARYIIVVPTAHAKFIEGVIYGQYPTAQVREVEDYSQEFPYQDNRKKFEIWGSEIHLTNEDYYPIRTYREFEDVLAEDDKFVDPHQSMVEAFTNINEGEHFWIQILVKPVSGNSIQKWSDAGMERISELSGEDMTKPTGLFGSVWNLFKTFPGELLKVASSGPIEPASESKDISFRIYNPSQDAEMKAILQKVSRSGYRVKIRVIHIAPKGKLQKPNYGKAIGVFKQFNSFTLNGFKPDNATKTNGPNFIAKQTRRIFRERSILLNYQWRDFWGDESGQFMNAEEIATLYHFPIKYVKAPGIERAASGGGSPPPNLPYV